MEFMLQILMSAEGFYSTQRCSCYFGKGQMSSNWAVEEILVFGNWSQKQYLRFLKPFKSCYALFVFLHSFSEFVPQIRLHC